MSLAQARPPADHDHGDPGCIRLGQPSESVGEARAGGDRRRCGPSGGERPALAWTGKRGTLVRKWSEPSQP